MLVKRRCIIISEIHLYVKETINATTLEQKARYLLVKRRCIIISEIHLYVKETINATTLGQKVR